MPSITNVLFTQPLSPNWVVFGGKKDVLDSFDQDAFADGNPNPIRYFLSTGIGGFSPLGQDRGDTFGLGWFLVGASDQFGPVPKAIFDPRNGIGVEWHYNIQATRWLNITPDLQWIRPGLGAISTDNAFVYGLRANATF
ncbi:MAG: carbohydrate porin [Planctomycetia bacterium]|nr:carbohydrate porin [Planctomycetia bacterium]